MCNQTWPCNERPHREIGIGKLLARKLQFPRQNFSNAEMSVGSLIAWPSLVTHPHLSAPITSGVKYSLTIWFELPLSLQ